MNYLKKIFFILASKSPRRIEILTNMELNFQSYKSYHNEELSDFKNIPDFVTSNAYLKAKSLSDEFPDKLIIGFDTIVKYNDTILGKPVNKEDAFKMLHTLSGKTHNVLTGYAFLDMRNNFKIKKFVSTDVTFKELDNEEINWYINTKEPFDKAGAYAIQGIGTFLIKKINGSYSNVVGLPVVEFLEDLKFYKEKIYGY